MNKLFVAFSLVSAILLSACGGGGGGQTTITPVEEDTLMVVRGTIYTQQYIYPYNDTGVMNVTLVAGDKDVDVYSIDLVKEGTQGSISGYLHDEEQMVITDFVDNNGTELSLELSVPMTIPAGTSRTLYVHVWTLGEKSASLRLAVKGVESSAVVTEMGRVETPWYSVVGYYCCKG